MRRGKRSFAGRSELRGERSAPCRSSVRPRDRQEKSEGCDGWRLVKGRLHLTCFRQQPAGADGVRVGTQPSPRNAARPLVVVFALATDVHVQDGAIPGIHLHVLDLVRAGDDFDAVDEIPVLIVERGMEHRPRTWASAADIAWGRSIFAKLATWVASPRSSCRSPRASRSWSFTWMLEV